MTETPATDDNVDDANVADPTPEAARQMALTIRVAHELSGNCWAVYSTKHRIAVMVGNCVVGGSNEAGKYDTVLSRSFLNDDQLTELDANQVPKLPKGYPQLTFPRLPDGDVFTRLADATDAHRAALEVLTATIKKAAHWKSHREDLKARIEALANVTLPSPAYLSDMPKPRIESPPVETPALSLSAIRDHFATSGLHYTPAQVATFVTALQTKGFVVLSGISGTGKSKIATGFVEMLPLHGGMARADRIVPTSLTSKNLTRSTMKHGQFALPKSLSSELPPIDLGKHTPIKLVVDGNDYKGSLGYYSVPGGESFKVFSARKALAALNVVGQVFLEFELDEDGGKVTTIRFVREDQIGSTTFTKDAESTEDIEAPDNHLFLSVRPDWRDSTSLLGYYNPLTQTYEWTDFLRFVIRAGENFDGPDTDRIAWFVILDEMNLAHVEYYFADLLSVLESGRDEDGWTKEALRITYPDTLADDVPPERVHMPPNLYIIGTVNMDETTHAFSPKVLDRAFTIELTDVDFKEYEIAGSAGSAALTDDDKTALLAAFSRGGRFARIDKAEAAAAVARHPEIRGYLQSLNVLLRQNRMHFGYRVFDEIAMYLAVNDENGMMDFEDAFDQAVFMKVLPKFTGSLARLRSPLHKVLAWAIDPTRTATADVSEASNQIDLFIQGKSESAWTAQPQFPVVAARVRDMLVTLETDGFVSFG